MADKRIETKFERTMKETHKKTLGGIRRYTNILSLAESGLTPSELKSSITSLLDPYFKNKKVLSELSVELLVPDAMNIIRVSADPWDKLMLDKVFEVYTTAGTANQSECFSGAAFWEVQIQQGLHEFWSTFHLEVDKSGLELDEFKFEIFRNIGAIVEACIQPHLKDLLHQVRITHGSSAPATGLDTMDLGVVVDNLIRTSGFPDLFAPKPWGIKLNQWRNMAQHHKTRIEDNEIVGVYGKGATGTEVRFHRDELLAAARKIFTIFVIIKTARSVFLIDNIDIFRSYAKSVVIRDDVHLLNLSSALAVQGFEMIDFEIDQASVSVSVSDVTSGDIWGRMMHSSQFVYPVWNHFQRAGIKVKLFDKSGEWLLTTCGKGEDCTKVGSGEIPFEEMANRVEFVFSKEGEEIYRKGPNSRPSA